MDLHLKQCINQEEEEESESESEQQHSPNISKFYNQQQKQPESSVSSAAVLPLFVPHSNYSKTSTVFSPFPHSTSFSNIYPRMWGYFSVAQRQELQLQAHIFRYMLAGAALPPELLHPINSTLLSSPTPFFLQHFPQYPTPCYWGRAAMDPEPGRCRRTDGKKWRCSRDVIAGQKYCERHMHRGRNRSRKPVETVTTNPTTTTVTGVSGGGGGCSLSSNPNRAVGGRPFRTVEITHSGQTPSVDLLHLNQRPYSNSLSENKNFYEFHKEGSVRDAKSDGHLLRHFFDDWPRSNNDERRNNGIASATPLSNSTPENPSSSSSDVSLKLSTGGSFDQEGGSHSHGDVNSEREHVQLNWVAGWGATQMASIGGPLAEVLRSTNNNSPTSVLHDQLQKTTNSEASFIST